MIHIRRGSLPDEAALRSFFLRAWGEAGPGALGWTGASDEAMEEIASHEFLASLLVDPDKTVFLAEDRDEVVGVAVMRKVDGSTLELAGIIVREGLTGRGVGSSLPDAATADAVAFGLSELVVKTEAHNTRALAFYGKHGFVATATRPETVRGIEVNLTVLRAKLR